MKKYQISNNDVLKIILAIVMIVYVATIFINVNYIRKNKVNDQIENIFIPAKTGHHHALRFKYNFINYKAMYPEVYTNGEKYLVIMHTSRDGDVAFKFFDQYVYVTGQDVRKAVNEMYDLPEDAFLIITSCYPQKFRQNMTWGEDVFIIGDWNMFTYNWLRPEEEFFIIYAV